MKSAKKAVKKAAVARKKAAAKKAGRVARKGVGRENPGLLVEVRNLGPVAHADLRLKNLTVLAGPNKTGKTFVSKALHSVFGAMNANHPEMFFQGHAEQIRGAARELWRQMPLDIRFPREREARLIMGRERSGRAALRDFLVDIESQLEEIGESIKMFPQKQGGMDANAVEELSGRCAKLSDFYRKRERDLIHAAQSQDEKKIARGYATALKNAIANLANVPWDSGEDMFIREGCGRAFFRNIRSNFQVHPSRLPRKLKGAASISIEGGLAAFTIARNGAAFKFSRAGLGLMQEQSRVIFLDSPIYWRLKSSLVRASFPSSSIRHRDGGIGGVPQYFYDLVALMDRGEAAAPNFPKLRDDLESAIGGKFFLSKTGMMLLFHENGIEHPLHSTASGVVNLGFLSFLLEKNLIDKDTYVFVDEPESNLHPEWQVKMAETLYELARGGVNIVIATHSIDILKRLEIYAKEDPDAGKLIAVNNFVSTGKGVVVDDNGGALLDKIIEVKKDLSKPFFKLFAQGL